jgi:hypothetical protein
MQRLSAIAEWPREIAEIFALPSPELRVALRRVAPPGLDHG